MIGNIILMVVCSAVLITAIIRRVSIFDEFLAGAKEGIRITASILPALIALVVCVSMLRACGLLELISTVLSPAAGAVGMPQEVIPLALVRPISGSGALAVISDIFSRFGSDSHIGQVASVMMGSTETTFYTIAVYYGCVGIKKSGATLPAALSADFAGMLMASLTVKLLM